MKKSKKKSLTQVIVFLLMLILALTFLFPIYFMGINSVKTKAQYRADPFGLPATPSLNNFSLLINNFKILDAFGNTAIIAVTSVIITLCISIFASYAFAKMRFRGKSFAYMALIATMFIPAQVTMVPLYFLMNDLGLTNKLISVILAYVATTLPGTVLLMTTSFIGINDEMIEAAVIDGAGYFDVIRNVVIPMGTAVIAINVIFNFLSASNDLFTPMILLQKADKRTMMVALSAIMAPRNGDPAYQQAGLLLSTIPALFIYMVFSKFIVKGITVGSIK